MFYFSELVSNHITVFASNIFSLCTRNHTITLKPRVTTKFSDIYAATHVAAPKKCLVFIPSKRKQTQFMGLMANRKFQGHPDLQLGQKLPALRRLVPGEDSRSYDNLRALQDLARGKSWFQSHSVADLLEKDKEKLLALLTWGLAPGPDSGSRWWRR